MPAPFSPSTSPSAGRGCAPATHLRVDGVSFSYGARRVLTDISLVVSAGERVALVGENGSGKSTLLRIAAGSLEPDAGEVMVPRAHGRAPRLGLLEQELAAA